MTPDDLRALREVAGCGRSVSTVARDTDGNVLTADHDKAVEWVFDLFGDSCDACLTLLLNAALAQRVERWASNPSNVLALAGSLGIATQHMNLTSVVQGAGIGRRALLAALTGGAK